MGVPETGNGYDSVAVDVDPAESNRFTGPNPAVEAGAGRVAKFHTGPSWIGHEMRTAELPSARRGHHFKKKKKKKKKEKEKRKINEMKSIIQTNREMFLNGF